MMATVLKRLGGNQHRLKLDDRSKVVTDLNPWNHSVSDTFSTVAAYQQATDATPRRAVADIYASGGLRAFFRGLPARTLSLAGTFTVVPLALDWFAVQ